LLSATAANIGPAPHNYKADYKTVRALLDQPEAQIDLAAVKVTVDHLVDPKIDKDAVLRQLDQMASEIAAGFTPSTSNLDKFKALRDYLYRPTPLSARKPFRYNLEDDMNPRAKLLSVYLDTHRGNCISMPVLFVILGQKLGIAMMHVYRSYLDLRQRLFIDKYPQPSDIPESLRPQFEKIEKSWQFWQTKIKRLGYIAWSPETDAGYRERIRRAKAENGIQ
jgi:hypothetical protein